MRGRGGQELAAEPDSAPYGVRRCPQAKGSLEFSQPERVPGAEYETGRQRTFGGILRRLRFLSGSPFRHHSTDGQAKAQTSGQTCPGLHCGAQLAGEDRTRQSTSPPVRPESGAAQARSAGQGRAETLRLRALPLVSAPPDLGPRREHVGPR